MDLQDVADDLSAFADDPGDVLIENSGDVLLVRGGREISFTLRSEAGELYVIQDQTKTPYWKFLGYDIARLDAFADRLILKRPPIRPFIDGPAKIESVSLEPQEGPALQLLHRECEEISPFCSRVIFITADAGHGKTALLREYQARQAKGFLEGKSKFLFWHVDLQGRQLLRLHEALMGDLGELRISGIWMAGIIRLLRHGMLVLAIDGFDELAAEQGRTDALGALATMVQQMQDKGVIVAASRRTFFDTEDYARRTGLLRRRVSSDCEFDQIHLRDWTRTEDIQYLSEIKIDDKKGFDNPNNIYDEILKELQSQPTHPMLTRPFLLTHLARMLLLYNITPSDLIKGMHNPLEGVAEVVRAFIDREVSEKWKERDTGKPYLTSEQHMQLLATIAQEMWSGQVDRLPIDVVETITVLLLEEWKISEDRKRQVLEMVRMHVMLTIPSDGDEGARSFDHPEFRNYFVAYSLANVIKRSLNGLGVSELGAFLSVAQLPDGVAKYAAGMLERDSNFIKQVIALMNNLVAREWKPTFLQTNVGTIIPWMANGYEDDDVIHIKGNIVFSSLVFEDTGMKNVIIEGGSFLNVSFMRVKWENINFNDCNFTEITLDKSATYKDVRLVSCSIAGVKIYDGGDEILRAYSPERIRQIMKGVGIDVENESIKDIACESSETEKRRLANRLLRIFRRTTLVSEHILNLKIASNQQKIVFEEIIPLMEKKNLIESKPWRGGGKSKHLWGLKRGLDEILRADCGEGDPDIVKFWAEVDKL
jgi:hypothetical protein